MAQTYTLNGVEIALPETLATDAIREKLTTGRYEAAEARAAMRVVRAGFRVLELGAGIGYVTALCAARTAPENVLSVEANPDLLPVIEANLARNKSDGVSLFHGAVVAEAAEDATVSFAVSPGFTASRVGGSAPRQIEVPAIGFHDLLRAHRPHVVLMDIEGAEADLFDTPWPCPLRFCVMELHPKRYGARRIKRIVDAMSAMNMTYDPATSRGTVLGFRRVWESGREEAEA